VLSNKFVTNVKGIFYYFFKKNEKGIIKWTSSNNIESNGR